MSHDSADIIVGRIVGVHGIRGQVKVYSDCRPRESLFQYRQFTARQAGRPDIPLQLLRGQHSGKSMVASFAGIHDRDQALALGGYTLYISRAQLPATQEGEYYWADLVGLTVYNWQNELIGTVSSLMETGAHDILVVDGEHGRKLIPFVDHYIDNVDLEQGSIIADWGLDY